VYSRSNTADSLGDCPGSAWITTFQDCFDATEHGTATPGIAYHTIFYFNLNSFGIISINRGKRVFLACPSTPKTPRPLIIEKTLLLSVINLEKQRKGEKVWLQ
jgi:hypothetical protein